MPTEKKNNDAYPNYYEENLKDCQAYKKSWNVKVWIILGISNIKLLGSYSYFDKSETTMLLSFNVLLPQSLGTFTIDI